MGHGGSLNNHLPKTGILCEVKTSETGSTYALALDINFRLSLFSKILYNENSGLENLISSKIPCGTTWVAQILEKTNADDHMPSSSCPT